MTVQKALLRSKLGYTQETCINKHAIVELEAHRLSETIDNCLSLSGNTLQTTKPFEDSVTRRMSTCLHLAMSKSCL